MKGNMSTTHDIQTSIAQVAKVFGLELSPSEIKLEHPANPDFGDWSSNIALARYKDAKKPDGTPFSNPREFATELQKELLTSSIPVDNVAGPGFLNFKITDSTFLEALEEIIAKDGQVIQQKHTNKRAIVEFSSPNIAKPFTIGHLRSTIIGSAVANILQSVGYEVLRDNHLGDWGTQFGKLIYAIKTWGDIEEISAADRPVKKLVELYVKFHDEAEKNPSIEDTARSWFKKLEEGDEEAKQLWEQCIEWSWIEFQKIYDQLDIHFSEEFDQGRGLGESFFEDKMDVVIEELRFKQLLKDKYPPLMIIKKDGATLYATRDLAADKYRLDNFGKETLIINEVGIEQSLYFQQLFETEKMLGWVKDGQRIHVKHGHYRFKDQKMSTRKGNVIWLEDVLEEARSRAFEMSTKNLSWKEEGTKVVSSSNRFSESANAHATGLAIAFKNQEAIAFGALKWNDLRRKSELNIVFDWDEILNMEGNSGPYIQYTYARCKSVLNKAEDIDYSTQASEQVEFAKEELAVLRLLTQFDEVVQRAASEYSPHYICTYLFELAQAYNSFYNTLPILKAEDEKLLKFRLSLTKATSLILQKGLQLLGIKTVEQM
jgi:arginyl-tRNA synthetase